MKNKPSLYWHYDTAKQLAEAYTKLKASDFTVSRPRNSGLFEQVEKALGEKV